MIPAAYSDVEKQDVTVMMNQPRRAMHGRMRTAFAAAMAAACTIAQTTLKN
eukprot:gene610-10028_t